MDGSVTGPRPVRRVAALARSGRLRSAVATGIALVVGLAVAACTGEATTPTPNPPGLPGGGGVPGGAFRLVAFDSCADLQTSVRAAAKASVGPWGFTTMGLAIADDGAVSRDLAAEGGAPPPGAAPDAAKGAPAPGGAPEHSTTNTHEAGVDEPDMVKTDGRRIVTVSGNTLHVVDAANRKTAGRLTIPTPDPQASAYGEGQLLLSGDRALVFTGINLANKAFPETLDDGRALGGLLLTLVDLSGPPRVAGQYTFDGMFVDARQIGSMVRVVARSAPVVRFPANAKGSEAARVQVNREVIDRTPVDAWLPRYSTVDGSGARTTGRVECDAVSRPAQYSAASMVSVLSFDLSNPNLGTGDPVTVMADGDTVYANGPSLYIANDQRWQMWRTASAKVAPSPIPPRTQLYRFAIDGKSRPRFTAAGEVNGWLLNQYSLSEWDGHLRVATTSSPPWQRGGERGQSESTVFVLREDGGTLAQTGKVGGLGKGERIYAVRFVGTTGYVVTFRQTDPLYTLDLRDVRAPKVVGELKINGYSAYLHPAGDGRLLGIGQEADDDGRTQGTQVSLFDVSNLAQPTRIAQHHTKGAHSEAENNPHALLYWPSTGLLIVPIVEYGNSSQRQGALALSVRDKTITEMGRIEHPATSDSGGVPAQIRRSLIIDQTLWTLSDAGVRANDLNNLAGVTWLALR